MDSIVYLEQLVRLRFPIVDLLIATVKKLFLKASPSRVLNFKFLYANLCLSPEIIFTPLGN